jgi:hypothetical protein
MRKAEALDHHLERALEEPGFWGVCDCFLWPADWIVARGRPDPAADYRGRYATALGAARIVNAAGGAEALWRTMADRSGLPPTRRPIAGDVGLVRHPTSGTGNVLRGVLGAVCLGAGVWAARTSGGVRTGRWSVIQAWRVSCPKP